MHIRGKLRYEIRSNITTQQFTIATHTSENIHNGNIVLQQPSWPCYSKIRTLVHLFSILLSHSNKFNEEVVSSTSYTSSRVPTPELYPLVNAGAAAFQVRNNTARTASRCQQWDNVDHIAPICKLPAITIILASPPRADDITQCVTRRLASPRNASDKRNRRHLKPHQLSDAVSLLPPSSSLPPTDRWHRYQRRQCL